MAKLIFATLLFVSLIGKSAPQYNSYDNLLRSQSFLEQVEITSKIYARQILESLPATSSSIEIKQYNWCQDVLASKYNSVIIYRIASFVCNEVYLPNIGNPTGIYDDLLTAYTTTPNGVTIWDIIGKVNLP